MVLIIVALALMAVLFSKHGIPRKDKGKAIPIVVAPVRLGSISEILEISGEIEANKKAVDLMDGIRELRKTLGKEGVKGFLIPLEKVT